MIPIDADALLKCIPYEDVNSRFAVQNAPTIEQRKKGKWIELRCRILWWECSECSRGVLNRSNFCPNCGADMRGESDGTD